ncbi:MAG: hypothetical protein ACTSWN_05735 [Promethearchaeota archaeon]
MKSTGLGINPTKQLNTRVMNLISAKIQIPTNMSFLNVNDKFIIQIPQPKHYIHLLNDTSNDF